MAAINYSKYIVRKSFVAEKFYGRFLFQTGFSEHEIAVLFTKVSEFELHHMKTCLRGF